MGLITSLTWTNFFEKNKHVFGFRWKNTIEPCQSIIYIKNWKTNLSTNDGYWKGVHLNVNNGATIMLMKNHNNFVKRWYDS